MNQTHPVNSYPNYLGGDQNDIGFLTPPFGSTLNNQGGFPINYHGPITNHNFSEMKPKNNDALMGMMQEPKPTFTAPPLRLESRTLPAFNSTDAGEHKASDINAILQSQDSTLNDSQDDAIYDKEVTFHFTNYTSQIQADAANKKNLFGSLINNMWCLLCERHTFNRPFDFIRNYSKLDTPTYESDHR